MGFFVAPEALWRGALPTPQSTKHLRRRQGGHRRLRRRETKQQPAAISYSAPQKRGVCRRPGQPQKRIPRRHATHPSMARQQLVVSVGWPTVESTLCAADGNP
jgi:hypothetical protein